MICSFLDRQKIRSGRMAIMPAKKKAAKTGSQASGKAKADAQNSATAEQKAPQISGASTRIFGKTEEEATAIILQIQEEMTTAIEEASKRALEAAQGWDATNHRQGLDMAAPIMTVLKILKGENLLGGGASGRRDQIKHFLNLPAISDATSNSTGGEIKATTLNDAVAQEAQEPYAKRLFDFKIWTPKGRKSTS